MNRDHHDATAAVEALPMGRFLGPATILLLTFAVACVSILASVHTLRRGDLQRQQWLSDVEEAQARLQGPGVESAAGLSAVIDGLYHLQVQWLRAGEPTQRLAVRMGNQLAMVRDRIVAHGASSPQVDVGLQQLSRTLSDQRGIIDGDRGRIQRDLASFWGPVSVVVVAALILALSNGLLLLRLVRQGFKVNRATAALAWQAAFDPLTGVLNRYAILSRTSELASAGPIAALMVDIDDLRSVNDSLGNDVGDALLVSAAKRLKVSIRGADAVGRYAGGTFLIVLGGVAEEAASRVAERVHEMFTQEITIAGHLIRRTVSVGMVISAGAITTGPEVFIARAERALRTAKRRGPGQTSTLDAEPEVAQKPIPPPSAEPATPLRPGEASTGLALG